MAVPSVEKAGQVNAALGGADGILGGLVPSDPGAADMLAGIRESMQTSISSTAGSMTSVSSFMEGIGPSNLGPLSAVACVLCNSGMMKEIMDSFAKSIEGSALGELVSGANDLLNQVSALSGQVTAAMLAPIAAANAALTQAQAAAMDALNSVAGGIDAMSGPLTDTIKGIATMAILSGCFDFGGALPSLGKISPSMNLAVNLQATGAPLDVLACQFLGQSGAGDAMMGVTANMVANASLL